MIFTEKTKEEQLEIPQAQKLKERSTFQANKLKMWHDFEQVV